MTNSLPPTVQKVLDIDGLYFDERELLLAAWADGLSVALCRILVTELDSERNEEIDAQQEAEMAIDREAERRYESPYFYAGLEYEYA